MPSLHARGSTMRRERWPLHGHIARPAQALCQVSGDDPRHETIGALEVALHVVLEGMREAEQEFFGIGGALGAIIGHDLIVARDRERVENKWSNLSVQTLFEIGHLAIYCDQLPTFLAVLVQLIRFEPHPEQRHHWIFPLGMTRHDCCSFGHPADNLAATARPSRAMKTHN
jgi:hypothetical protein